MALSVTATKLITAVVAAVLNIYDGLTILIRQMCMLQLDFGLPLTSNAFIHSINGPTAGRSCLPNKVLLWSDCGCLALPHPLPHTPWPPPPPNLQPQPSQMLSFAIKTPRCFPTLANPYHPTCASVLALAIPIDLLLPYCWLPLSISPRLRTSGRLLSLGCVPHCLIPVPLGKTPAQLRAPTPRVRMFMSMAYDRMAV